jgi:5-methyltetrahydrofolate--homocysteine methyltransferase
MKIDFAQLNQYVYEGKAALVAEMVTEGLNAGVPVNEILEKGLIAGMSVLGEDFKHNIRYVPEVLIAARAMKEGQKILKPYLTGNNSAKKKGVLVIGTVKGDLHDIGKNLVVMMAEGAGFEVYDIGIDRSYEDFIDAAQKYKADLVGMSALLTTTMPYMRTVIEKFKENNLQDIKLVIGGAPINQKYADEINADGYGADAASSVNLFEKLINISKL